MGKFSKISTEAFKEIQFDAGMVLSKFDLKGTTAIAGRPPREGVD